MTLPLLVEGYNPDWKVDLVSSSGAVFRQDESCTQLMTESGESLVVNGDRLVVESSGQDYGSADVVAIQGTFQREGVPNANKRIYPKGMFTRLLGENSPAFNCIKSKAMCGHLEHPSDGITDLKKIAIVVTECKVQPDGTVWGRAEVLKTTDGLQARALLEGGVRIGISSRGRGTVGAGGVVNDDYILETFDLVYNPSTPGAHPSTSTSQRESVADIAESAVHAFITSKENPMSFDFAAFEARVRPLLEQDIARLEVYQRGEVSAKLIEGVQVALAAVKADPGQQVLLSPLIQQMQEKRTVLANAGVNEAKVLEERVEELSSALTEAQEAAAEQKQIADAGVALSEALVEEFKAKLAEIDESESEEGADESDEDVEIEEADEESEDAEALREALSVLKAKYDAACQIIEELTKSEEAVKVDPVKESIDAVVTKHPFLAESRALLERETSVEQVAVVAEALIKMAVKAGVKIEESTDKGAEKPETKDSKIEESTDASRPKGKTVASDGASSTATLTESATAKTTVRGKLISEMNRLGKF
jgi:hypothetical protein